MKKPLFISISDSDYEDDCFTCQAIKKMEELGRPLTPSEEQEVLERVQNKIILKKQN